jgi:hypothetical protein
MRQSAASPNRRGGRENASDEFDACRVCRDDLGERSTRSRSAPLYWIGFRRIELARLAALLGEVGDVGDVGDVGGDICCWI